MLSAGVYGQIFAAIFDFLCVDEMSFVAVEWQWKLRDGLRLQCRSLQFLPIRGTKGDIFQVYQRENGRLGYNR